MSLLTRDEIEQVIKTTDGPKSEWMQYVCRAIEAAVIKRLAGVSVEPVGHLDGTDYLAEFMSMGLRAQQRGCRLSMRRLTATHQTTRRQIGRTRFAHWWECQHENLQGVRNRQAGQLLREVPLRLLRMSNAQAQQ